VAVGGNELLGENWRWPGRRFGVALGGWRELRRQERTFRPELVEFYGAEFGLAAYAAKRKRERPLLVAHTNGLELLATEALGHRPRAVVGRLHRWLDRAAFTYIDAFVGICELDREFLVQRGYVRAERTAVIEPGLDAEFLAQLGAPLEGREHAVAYTGSWVPRKNLPALVEVMTTVMRADAAVEFRVFGAAGAEAAVRAAFPSDLRERVRVAGKLTNAELAAELTRCKVFFFPSRYEGYGMALAEAMVCGCAAVTTPTGLGGSVRAGVEAVIYRAEEREKFVWEICDLLGDEAKRRRIAEAGRNRVAGLTWSAQGEKLSAFYEGLRRS
jgi:glycosyltransferase involved in cell wall biosynthesis